MTEARHDKRPESADASRPTSTEPATSPWSGGPGLVPPLAGLALGATAPGAASVTGIRVPDEPPPAVSTVPALRRVAAHHAARAGHRPVIRRKWGKRKRGDVQPWEYESPGDAPTGMYARDDGFAHLPEAQRPWRGGPLNLLYQNVNSGPGPLFGAGAVAAGAGAAAGAGIGGAGIAGAGIAGPAPAAAAAAPAVDGAIDPDTGELAKRPRRPAPAVQAAPGFTLATFDGLVRPPRTGDPRYKHASMPARLTPEMARDAQTQAGKRTLQYLTATQDGAGNLADAGINRDHFLSNFAIARLVRAIVPYLRATPAADGAAFAAWTRALVGDNAAYQAQVDAELATAIGTGADRRLITLLAQAANNLVFGQAEANQHAGHGMDVPRYRGRIAPYAQAILDATTALTPLVALTGDRAAVLDATSQSMDTTTGSYVSSSTPIGEEASYRRPMVADDAGLTFYSSSRVPLTRSNSGLGRLQHRPPAAFGTGPASTPAPVTPASLASTTPASATAASATSASAAPPSPAAASPSPVSLFSPAPATLHFAPPAAGGPGPVAGAGLSPRQALQAQMYRALDDLRDRWRAADPSRAAAVPPGYHDWRDNIHSLGGAPAHLPVDHLKADAEGWLASASIRWGV